MHIGILNEAVVALKLVKVSLYEACDLISLQQYEFMHQKVPLWHCSLDWHQYG
jgi:hypothetical protein